MALFCLGNGQKCFPDLGIIGALRLRDVNDLDVNVPNPSDFMKIVASYSTRSSTVVLIEYRE